MALTVLFVDGPANGIVQTYPHLDRALPVLLWTDATGERSGAYRCESAGPDRQTGYWRYRAVRDRSARSSTDPGPGLSV
jgi:hypothetical protein